MKFNFGTGIALVYGLFAVSMLIMVGISFKHDPGLVQKDYYNLDLNYQAHLDSKKNAAALPYPPTVMMDEAKKAVIVRLPEGMTASEGKVKIYRSASVKDDQLLELHNQGVLEIPAAQLPSGRWHVEMNWSSSDKSYYYETTLFI